MMGIDDQPRSCDQGRPNHRGRSKKQAWAVVLVAAAVAATGCGANGDATPPASTTPEGDINVNNRGSQRADPAVVASTTNPTQAAPPASAGSVDEIPILYPALYPSTANVDSPVEVTLSVSPRGTIEDAPTVEFPGGTALLRDDGTNGDLAANNGTWTLTWLWTPLDEGTNEITVRATIDGVEQSASTTINVLPGDVPSEPEVPGSANIITDDSVTFAADRIIVITEPDADSNLAVAAASRIGGEITGVVGQGFWQVSIAPVASLNELQTHMQTLSTAPGVIGAEPDYAATFDNE